MNDTNYSLSGICRESCEVLRPSDHPSPCYRAIHSRVRLPAPPRASWSTSIERSAVCGPSNRPSPRPGEKNGASHPPGSRPRSRPAAGRAIAGVSKLSPLFCGERGRNRTFNLLIKSQLLCQLSYAPVPEVLPEGVMPSPARRHEKIIASRRGVPPFPPAKPLGGVFFGHPPNHFRAFRVRMVSSGRACVSGLVCAPGPDCRFSCENCAKVAKINAFVRDPRRIHGC